MSDVPLCLPCLDDAVMVKFTVQTSLCSQRFLENSEHDPVWMPQQTQAVTVPCRACSWHSVPLSYCLYRVISSLEWLESTNTETAGHVSWPVLYGALCSTFYIDSFCVCLQEFVAALHDTEKKQKELLLFELRTSKDAGRRKLKCFTYF